jgi:hypothetical protein
MSLSYPEDIFQFNSHLTNSILYLASKKFKVPLHKYAIHINIKWSCIFQAKSHTIASCDCDAMVVFVPTEFLYEACMPFADCKLHIITDI